MPQRSDSPGHRDAVLEQLEVLNAEAKVAADKLNKTQDVLVMAVKAKDNDLVAILTKYCVELRAEKAQLDERRQALEAKLPGEQHSKRQPACCEQTICHMCNTLSTN